MSIFVNRNETVLVEFDSGPLAGQWIRIRARLSGPEKKRLSAARFSGVKSASGADDGATVIEVDFTRDTARRLLAWVVKWSLIDPETNRPAAINERTIDMLDEEACEQIEKAIEAREAEIADELEAKLNPLPESSSAPTPTDGSPADPTWSTSEPPSSGDASA